MNGATVWLIALAGADLVLSFLAPTLGLMRNLRRRRVEHQVAPGQWSTVVTARLAVVRAVE